MKIIEDLGELIRDIVDAFKKGFDKDEEVEIIEEEKKIEKLKMYELTTPETEFTEDLKLTYEGVTKTFQETRNKINELIDEINKLKENKNEKH